MIKPLETDVECLAVGVTKALPYFNQILTNCNNQKCEFDRTQQLMTVPMMEPVARKRENTTCVEWEKRDERNFVN